MGVSLEQAKQRFSEAGFSRSDRYAQGTEGKGQSWNAAKARAKSNYVPAMQEALQADAYGKGLEKSTAADYDRGVRDKGVNNWPVGMQASADKFGDRIQKFTPLWNQALPTTSGPRRSAANMKRMTENVQRFIATAGK